MHDDVSAILNAIDKVNDVNEEPRKSANELFYASIAARAEILSRRDQAKMQMNVLQLINKYEFGEGGNSDNEYNDMF